MCDKFDKVFLEFSNKHSPLKRNLCRLNHASYVSKAMQKAVKRVLKKSTEKSLRTYKSKKYCRRLYKKERKTFFNNLNSGFVSNNKLFLKHK